MRFHPISSPPVADIEVFLLRIVDGVIANIGTGYYDVPADPPAVFYVYGNITWMPTHWAYPPKPALVELDMPNFTDFLFISMTEMQREVEDVDVQTMAVLNKELGSRKVGDMMELATLFAQLAGNIASKLMVLDEQSKKQP